jgi:hypothetical protein
LDIPDLPKDKRILDNTWISGDKYKADGTVERYKARLVARGDLQDPTSRDYNELFAPVVRFDLASKPTAIPTHPTSPARAPLAELTREYDIELREWPP